MDASAEPGRRLRLDRDRSRHRFQVRVAADLAPDPAADPAGPEPEPHPDGAPVGFTEYLLAGDLMVFIATELDPEYDRPEVVEALFRHALDEARDQGYRIRASCPRVSRFLAEHAGEYPDPGTPA